MLAIPFVNVLPIIRMVKTLSSPKLTALINYGPDSWISYAVTQPTDLTPLSIVGTLDSGRLLRALNTPRQPGEEDLRSKLSKSGVLVRQSMLVKHNENVQLRIFVDDWLSTGVKHDGVENPRERNLQMTHFARQAIHRFANNTPLHLAVGREGISIQLPSEPSVPLLRSPEQKGAEAARMFSLLCLSSWRMRLAKCRRVECGLYFLLKHPNRIYKSGTRCPDCTRKTSLLSAQESTKAHRLDGEAMLYKVAAARFSKQITRCPDWYKDSGVVSEIIGQLNREIEKRATLKSLYPNGLTQKWLSWQKNREGIMQTLSANNVRSRKAKRGQDLAAR